MLIDSGASLSALKYETIRNMNLPIQHEYLTINGIGGEVQADGYVYVSLNINGKVFRHKFYVIKFLPCNQAGIIGRDFLYEYKAILNFENNTLALSNCDDQVCIKMNPGSLGNNTFLSIPPRCEMTFYIDSVIKEDCVVLPKELCEGVFMAGSICKPNQGKIRILILNTRESQVNLNYFRPEVESFSDYSILHFEKHNNIDADRVKKLFSLLQLEHLNKEERTSIRNICAKFSDIFQLPGDKLTTTKIYDHSIQLKPHVDPVYVKQYRLPFSQRDEVEKQVKNMLSDGIIEPAKSEWSSPVLLVPKKSDDLSKKWRLVIDFRKLNDRILNDKFPLPNITDILDSLSGAIYFTQLDLSQAYFQANLEANSRKYTAFTTPSGQYQMTRMPMGLKTSPSSFSRLMTVAMSGLNYDKCFVYLDNIICFGRNLSSHNKNLMDILTRLRKVNLKLNPLKCDFLRKEILFLGHIVSADGIKPDPKKIESVKNYPTPTNTDEVKRFVAFANYYRKFIPNFAEKALELNKLCRKYARFEWNEKCEKAFSSLKWALTTPPILQYPNFDPSNTFILQTDASSYAIGSVLCNGDNKPVAYASRNLNQAEIRYPTIEKELLAIVWSVKYFRPYLYGRQFVIRTDHRPLIYLFNMTNPSSRLTKFRLALEEYMFEIEYVKGRDNAAADALSRIRMSSDDLKAMNEKIVSVLTRAQKKKMTESDSKNFDNTLVEDAQTDDRTDHPRVVEVLKPPKNYTELIFVDENEWRRIKKDMTEETELFAYSSNKNIVYIKSVSQSYCTRDVFMRELTYFCNKVKVDCLYVLKNENNVELIKELAQSINNQTKWTGPRLCVLRNVIKVDNKDTQRVILNDYHMLPTSGHVGIRRMLNNIRQRYFWPGLENDVTDFVKRCDQCQRLKHFKHTKEPMIITNHGNCAFDRIYLDLVGPLPKDSFNNIYILSLQCDLTKYVEAYPLTSKHTEVVAASLVNNFILRYGIPREIISDRGTEFVSSTMQQVCKLLKITHLTSTAYHHQTIGSLENTHKNLITYLRIQTENQSDWSTWLQYWCFAFNTTVHTETRYSPYELVFGKYCNIPSNLCNSLEPLYNFSDYAKELKYRLQKSQYDAKLNLSKSKINRKTRYDSYLNSVSYKAGDRILIRNDARKNKLEPVYNGPYDVIRDDGSNVIISHNGKDKVVHKNRTKLYHNL